MMYHSSHQCRNGLAWERHRPPLRSYKPQVPYKRLRCIIVSCNAAQLLHEMWTALGVELIKAHTWTAKTVSGGSIGKRQ